jgi:SAM-dependent methyltransferase
MKGECAFLRHKAFAGGTYLHPCGAGGTRRLLAALAPVAGQRLVEVGCGTGSTLTHVASAYRACVYGVDVLPEMLAVARRRIRWTRLQAHATVHLADAAALPFADHRFDSGYAESALGFHPVDQVRQILREIVRVLRVGARFAANELVWLPGISAAEVQIIWDATRQDYGLAPALNEPWTWQHWDDEFRRAGFVVLSNQPLDRGTALPWLHPRAVPSCLVTGLYQLRGLLSTQHVRERLDYRRRMRQGSGTRPVLEPRLFVLEKA